MEIAVAEQMADRIGERVFKEARRFVVVSIMDSGAGIAEEVLPHIFEAFYTTKPSGEGTGLGLDIVRKIVEKHAGEITLESRPGQTTFTVWLPVDGAA